MRLQICLGAFMTCYGRKEHNTMTVKSPVPARQTVHGLSMIDKSQLGNHANVKQTKVSPCTQQVVLRQWVTEIQYHTYKHTADIRTLYTVQYWILQVHRYMCTDIELVMTVIMCFDNRQTHSPMSRCSICFQIKECTSFILLVLQDSM